MKTHNIIFPLLLLSIFNCRSQEAKRNTYNDGFLLFSSIVGTTGALKIIGWNPIFIIPILGLCIRGLRASNNFFAFLPELLALCIISSNIMYIVDSSYFSSLAISASIKSFLPYEAVTKALDAKMSEKDYSYFLNIKREAIYELYEKAKKSQEGIINSGLVNTLNKESELVAKLENGGKIVNRILSVLYGLTLVAYYVAPAEFTRPVALQLLPIGIISTLVVGLFDYCVNGEFFYFNFHYQLIYKSVTQWFNFNPAEIPQFLSAFTSPFVDSWIILSDTRLGI